MPSSLILQQPPRLPADQLMLLFHGIGAEPRQMKGLGERLAAAFPNAFIVSVAAPHPCDMGTGRQWFSLRDINEELRVARVRAALPAFESTVRHWQAVSGASIEATALIGFSQGAIMALESTRDREALAGRVISIAGRFARLPERATLSTTLHLFHGKHDAIVEYGHTVAAAERLVALGGDVTADVIPFIGHEVHADIELLLIERLQGYLPQRRWAEAMRADRGPPQRK
jgi:phospholipase/carboxylesterase